MSKLSMPKLTNPLEKDLKVLKKNKKKGIE